MLNWIYPKKMMDVCERLVYQLSFVTFFAFMVFGYTQLDFSKEKNIDIFCSELEVTGSEDANVYFYDLARPKNSCVNKLQVCDILDILALFATF
jgi:hypothetical protein